MIATLIVVVAITVLSPRRQVSADTVPGRYGALLLRCAGTFDLRRVEWIAQLEARPYWAQVDDDGALVSVYGPAPALVGSVAMLGAGDAVDDDTLRRRERIAAAFLVGLATCALVLAALARRSLRASLGIGAVAALSFAGAATLGQGLWQQTVALPPLAAALATLAWRERMPRLALATPALLALAIMLRPTIAPLALGLGIAWLLDRRPLKHVAIAAVLAIAAISPLAIWYLLHFGSPIPTGQLAANAAVTDSVFVLSRAQLGYGLGGLLVSPGRGLLWFAPIVIVGVVLSLRGGPRFDRAIAGAILAQILFVAFFHMWWGGVCYGPRFLVEATWIGIWLALSRDVRRAFWIPAVAVTVVVGQLGLWRWRAEQWETRRMPDIDQNALWDFVDSPVPATLTSSDEQLLALDAPHAPPVVRCEAGHLR